MATKKKEESVIQDAEFIEVANTPEKVFHEVEFELSNNFLEKNPTIKEIYDNGKIKIGLLPNIGNEFSDEIVKLIPELNSSELTVFNPLIDTINTLASYDYIVGTEAPERLEDEDDKEYQKKMKAWLDSEKQRYMGVSNDIKSFNGTTTKTKKELKDPILERGRRIDALYNTLKAFSDERREKVSLNFKPFLDKVEEIKNKKQEAIDKKNKEQTEQLQKAAEDAQEKLQVSEKKNSYADLVVEINSYFTDSQEKIESLNISGLITLKEEVTNKTFDVSSQGPAEQIKLEGNISTLRKGTIAVIDQSIISESAVPVPSSDIPENAHIAETLYGSEKSDSFIPTFNTEVTNDAENFANIVMRFNMIIGEIGAMKDFTDPKLQKMNKTFNTQKSLLKENVKKLSNWIVKKQELYNQQ